MYDRYTFFAVSSEHAKRFQTVPKTNVVIYYVYKCTNIHTIGLIVRTRREIDTSYYYCYTIWYWKKKMRLYYVYRSVLYEHIHNNRKRSNDVYYPRKYSNNILYHILSSCIMVILIYVHCTQFRLFKVSQLVGIVCNKCIILKSQ